MLCITTNFEVRYWLLIYLILQHVFCTLPPSPPQFSWETLPTFIHCSNNTGEINDDTIKHMSTFPIVTVTKSQDSKTNASYCTYPCEEDKIIHALHKIRNYSNSSRTIFYLNSVLNVPQYRLSTQFQGENESLLLHDSNGKLLHYRDCHGNSKINVTMFDVSQNETRQVWLNTVKYALTNKPGVVDGIFADKNDYVNISRCGNITTQKSNEWMQGHTLLFQQAQQIISSIQAF